MSKVEFQDCYIDHLLNALDEVSSGRLRRHLPDCQECQVELKELSDALHSLPLALESIASSPQLKNQLLARIASTAQPRPAVSARSGLRGWRAAAVAAGIIVVLLAGLVFQGRRISREQNLHIASLLAEIDELRDANQSLILKVDSLSRPSVRFLNLVGLTSFEGSSASAFIRPEDGRISLFFHQLPALEANQDFQLWVIEEGQPPHPSATFDGTGPVTEVEVDLPIAADQVQVLAVTIEPQGGSPQPTGAMVLAGP